MKNNIYIIKTFLLLVFLISTISGYAQIVLNPNPNVATCNLGSYGAVTVSVPSEALTGDNIALNITLPGTLPAHCTKTVTVTRSSNLLFQSSGAIPFAVVPGAPLSHQNVSPLAGNDGQNFNLFYKFPNYTTCNGTIGTFDVTVTVKCGEEEISCTTTVNVMARADNYWTVTKEFVTGNLTCGISVWRIRVHHNNPNGSGLGTYRLQGTITESPSVPVISGGVININNVAANNSSYVYTVYLQNCSPEGSTITNTANYNFTLGDGTCGTMNGTVTATSPALSSPNASIAFTKSIVNGFYTNLTPGCQARYQIAVCNNGNVPWTNLVITDDFNIPGITITGPHSLPPGWSFTNTGGVYTFTNPGAVLNPGECLHFFLDFEIDAGATIGSTITNTAHINYQAAVTPGGSGTPSNSCPGINCPTIDTHVQNTSATNSFVVEAPKAIPSIKKCIVDPPSSIIPPIYQIGDVIKFSMMIGNSGAGNLTETINDLLGMPGQNLQIIPGSINYTYYADQNYGYRNSCNPPFTGTGVTPPFTVTANTADLQNPSWTINGMPGVCEYNRSNYLIIEFEALILPQLHGTKTNTVSIPYGSTTLSSAVNYSVDQVGILAVQKSADAEIVENGQTFNYIINVSNNGSVPLNNIVINDILPNCAVVNGQVTITDGSGTVPYTSSGNIQININPATQLQPGDTFTITIPVVKSGGGICCNESVSVTANMVTSNIGLSANYGSAEEPAACVESPFEITCCDVADFSAELVEQNGKFYVTINGGSVPIQEVNISMVDYQVNYSEAACQPNDMGIFGTLSTNTNNLSGLLLNAGDNNTHSLTWLPGTPSIINGQVVLDIAQPNVLDISCCEATLSFCIKVRIQDVNCNVCEKIICYTPDSHPEPQEPCDLTFRDIGGRQFCVGDVMTINWSGTTPSGAVDIALVDVSNGTVYQVIATAIPNTGTYTYTIPAGIPCDPVREWMIVIQDKDNKQCRTQSNVFRIVCCEGDTSCDCGTWTSSSVTVSAFFETIPHEPHRMKATIKPYFGQKVDCGKSIQLKQNTYYSFTAPNFQCTPENCAVTYTWQVIGPDGAVESGQGKVFNHQFTSHGNYKVEFIPICGGKRCAPCVIEVSIPRRIVGAVADYHHLKQ